MLIFMQNLSILVYPIWKLHNPYCHNIDNSLVAREPSNRPAGQTFGRCTINKKYQFCSTGLWIEYLLKIIKKYYHDHFRYHISWNQNKVNWCIIENDHNFERNENPAIVFLKWTDFSSLERKYGELISIKIYACQSPYGFIWPIGTPLCCKEAL